MFGVQMNFYCPPTKLRERNVSSRVCHSVHRGGEGGHMWAVGILLERFFVKPVK